MPAEIAGRKIGGAHPAYIVLEAGPTHTGLESAKKLVDAAAEAGVDAVKFQMMDVDRLMGEKDVPFSYKVLTDRKTEAVETVEEPLYDILLRRSLKKEQWKALKLHCDRKKLAFISTFMFPEELDFLVDELEAPSVKLASGDICHFPLLRQMARKRVNVQIDTGSADLWEIERAVTLLESEGNGNIIIHLCPTGYPARLESIHLRMIATLKRMFGNHAVAFSDHTPGWDMDIAAVALGADLVEKTITLDRMTRSCEHMFSIEPHEAARFVKSIRDLEIAMGEARRTLPQEFRDGRKKARRSVFAVRDIRAGEALDDGKIDFRRPECGIKPDEWELLRGRKAGRDIAAGTPIAKGDLC
jgi:sialic acid synthase SpsE